MIVVKTWIFPPHRAVIKALRSFSSGGCGTEIYQQFSALYLQPIYGCSCKICELHICSAKSSVPAGHYAAGHVLYAKQQASWQLPQMGPSQFQSLMMSRYMHGGVMWGFAQRLALGFKSMWPPIVG